jgi:hypothetical protein
MCSRIVPPPGTRGVCASVAAVPNDPARRANRIFLGVVARLEPATLPGQEFFPFRPIDFTEIAKVLCLAPLPWPAAEPVPRAVDVDVLALGQIVRGNLLHQR